MASGMTKRVVKLDDKAWPDGLPCDNCFFTIWPDDLYTEVTYPSQLKKAWCRVCTPQPERYKTGERRDRDDGIS